ncbi:hypothetical protein N8J89_16800 [Crossiella sp. CA-258035]|uniref:hypothetical protein n=1 Tax=Crossiella sp. CA-258035 TaxID=2981138 RepID=UPI0024BCD2C5|nr:hypothetical protein [Crossiella sp. CA-258035]WHT22657.1 hypothetical protein N8J89_16800 [Crossiella sp. CA-258035]
MDDLDEGLALIAPQLANLRQNLPVATLSRVASFRAERWQDEAQWLETRQSDAFPDDVARCRSCARAWRWVGDNY